MITYNHAAFVEDAIKGILQQETDAKLKIIIGDDCSTDDTILLLDKYEKEFPDFIKVIRRNSNVGMMQNFVDVLRQCTGDYIAICEGDDYWNDPKKIAKQLDWLEKEANVDLVFTNAKVLKQESKEFGPNWASIKRQRFSTKDLLSGNFITTCTVLFRNKLSEPLLASLAQFKLGDWPLYLLLLNQSKSTAYFLDDHTAVYRQHVGGVYSTITTEKRIKSVLSVYEQLLKEQNFAIYRNLIFKKVSSIYYFLGCTTVSNTSAKEYFKQSYQLASLYNVRFPAFSMIRYLQRGIFKVVNF